ncbi:MAG: 50S ribosomal protein L7/L12 [Verrucomicrobia bacterium]|nr:50S ribosomal protein L7/L12 [Verrucomicrobiota bacterium]MBU6446557.1 50S ribosomal protein L7/L12 [Verrucomicrobiota bacterium]
MSQHLDDLVEKLSQLSVLDMAKLKEKLETKWGVKAAVAVAAAPGGAAPAAGGAPAAEATEFKVTLEGPIPDDKKISVIKAVREVTGLGLKEAKDLVEGAPKDLKPAAPKAEAEEIKKKIEAAGGKVKLTGL